MANGGAQTAALQFVHLKVHSSYSLLEGALPIEKMAKLAKAHGLVALGLTDTDNLFGALEFSDKLAGYGIQPIVGCSLAVAFAEKPAGDPAVPERPTAAGRPQRIALLAMTGQGYTNLMQLSSIAFLETPDGESPRVDLPTLARLADGLIALSGGPDGPIDRAIAAGQPAVAMQRLAQLKEIFGDRLYVEVQRHGVAAETEVEPELTDLAYRLALPLVATNEAYFPTPDDFEAHDALICIAEGSYVSVDDRRRLTPEHGFKSPAEMVALFRDLPEAIASTIEIARRCSFRPCGRKPILPQFVTGAAAADAVAANAAEAVELRRQAEEGLRVRLAKSGPAPDCNEEQYWQRLTYETEIIIKMAYQGYFLIVSDFIKWAKSQNIPVGPGRGSGAGSLVAYALTITDLDPMRFSLLFERFLNPERVSMPDFDIDFCQDRRDEVIRYVQGKYGADRVAQIITYGKLQARAVLRDVGRVLQLPYGQVDRLCKLVPNNPANPVTLEQAIAGEPKIQEERDRDPLVGRLLDIGCRLEGLYRHASTHAAGVVIGDRPLTELVPLYRDPRSTLPATQFNMKWVEIAGLVKFDFLGLKTLTVLKKAVELLARRGVELDLMELGLDDRPTYELLARGDTVGVFQLESTGMRDSLRKLKPDRFGDIIAMVALYRPGPMDNIPTYISRKAGLEPVDYLHPKLKPLLEETYGVIIYQEQVMQIAQVLSGYSLGEADLLRRAMGKKIKEEMAKQKSRFVEGAVSNGVDAAQAEFIFELVDKFAGYGFNKSHAAAYALLAYQTAYLRANHPVEFIAASMTYDMGNADKLQLFVEEARRCGIAMRRPSVNRSDVEFVPEDGAIRFSLAALKTVGRGVVESLVAVRAEGGPFTDLGEFARRIDAKSVNRRVLEALIAAGALDDLNSDRGLLHANAENILAIAHRTAEDRDAGQNDLFGSGIGTKPEPLQLLPAKPWTMFETLDNEFAAAGQYLSGHPLDEFAGVVGKLSVHRWRDFEARALAGPGGRQGTLVGILTARKDRRSKSGNRFAFVSFSDQSGQFEAIVFSDLLAGVEDELEIGRPFLVHVAADVEGESVKLRAEMISPLERAARSVRKGIRILAAGDVDWSEVAGLIGQSGTQEVTASVECGGVRRGAEIRLSRASNISAEAAGRLRGLRGIRSVSEY